MHVQSLAPLWGKILHFLKNRSSHTIKELGGLETFFFFLTYFGYV